MPNNVPAFLELTSYKKDSVEDIKISYSLRFWSPGALETS